jgi:N-glycosylase/DNA lyase
MKDVKMKKNDEALKELKALYRPVKNDIESRLNEFEKVWRMGLDEDIFSELVFCLLTPQSKARSCDYAVSCLLEKDLVLKGSSRQIAKELRTKTRFHNNKAKYIVEARQKFTYKGKLSIKEKLMTFENPDDAREWFSSNIKGIGLKEASHFLRNIGMGEDLSILDRHILKNLVLMGVISEVPKSLSKKNYLDIEAKMKEFSRKVKIPLAHLDLLLWYKEAGEIFK